MTRLFKVWMVWGMMILVGSVVSFADEAAGRIADTGFGSFKLDEKGTLRQFNLSHSKTVYEPTTWRPNEGDEVKVAFTATPNKRGDVVLAVDKLTMVKAGPSTIANLTSPVIVEIVETGSSGVKVKLPKGQIVKFDFGRNTKRLPAGWVMAVGEKAKITFEAKVNRFTNRVGYAAEQIEKQP